MLQLQLPHALRVIFISLTTWSGRDPLGKVRSTIASSIALRSALPNALSPSPTLPARIKWKPVFASSGLPFADATAPGAASTHCTLLGLNCTSFFLIHSKVKRGSSASTRASLSPKPQCALTLRTPDRRSCARVSGGGRGGGEGRVEGNGRGQGKARVEVEAEAWAEAKSSEEAVHGFE